MLIVLNMVSFKPIQSVDHGRTFLEILERAGKIYVPEFINEKVAYRPGRYDAVNKHWRPGALLLSRSQPFELRTAVSIAPDSARMVMPSDVWMSVDISYFDVPHRLNELLELGEQLYTFLSACYGFVRLPWMPELVGALELDKGLPGIGWATWLGPEYEDLVQLPALPDITVRRMGDGGRLLVLPLPHDVKTPDPVCLHAHAQIARHVDPDVLQPPRPQQVFDLSGMERDEFVQGAVNVIVEVLRRPRQKQAARVPRFRFRKKVSKSALRRSLKVSRIGPRGFTRARAVRAILDQREPESTYGFPNDGAGGMFHFEELTAEEAKRLLDLLPPEQANDGQEYSPTFREMVALGERLPRIRFFGYRIVPQRQDERISIEGFYLPAEDATADVVAEINAYHPDELEWEEREGSTVLRAWWD